MNYSLDHTVFRANQENFFMTWRKRNHFIKISNQRNVPNQLDREDKTILRVRTAINSIRFDSRNNREVEIMEFSEFFCMVQTDPT